MGGARQRMAGPGGAPRETAGPLLMFTGTLSLTSSVAYIYLVCLPGLLSSDEFYWYHCNLFEQCRYQGFERLYVHGFSDWQHSFW